MPRWWKAHMGNRQPTLTLRGIVETAEKQAERAWRCLGLWIFTCGLFFRTRCLGGVVANRCRRASTLAWCAQGAKPLDFSCLTGGSSQHSKYHSHFLRQPAAFLPPATSHITPSQSQSAPQVPPCKDGPIVSKRLFGERQLLMRWRSGFQARG